MDITFLIGNGFDVNLGLKTRYRDFYKFYLKCETSDLDIENFKREISDNWSKWSDAEQAFGELTNNFIDRNTFEKCYNDFVYQLFLYLESEQNKLKISALPDEVNKAFTSIIYNFYSKKYLPQKSYNTINNIVTANIHSTWRFNFINFNYTASFDKLWYASEQSDNLYYHENNTGLLIYDSLSFSTNIHGTLDNGMVFGVDNSDQIANKIFAQNNAFKNYFIKTEAIEEAGFDTVSLSKDIISKSKIICVFGMSFGDTDRTWWNEIKEWIKTGPDNQLILYIYDPDIQSCLISDLRRKKAEIYNKLFQENISEVPKDIKDRVHFSFNKDLFGELKNLVEISEKSEKKKALTV